MIDAYNPGQEAVAITARPNVQAVQARHDPNASAHALVRALGSDTAQQEAARLTAEREERSKNEQALKIDAYTEQFMKDHQGGAVGAAQVRTRFPEMVPVIASRVAESIGRRQGEKDFSSVVERINADDSLRLDTGKRNAFITQERVKLFSAVPQGNDFYASGMVGAMDRLLREQELKWQQQTAVFHEQVQTEALGREVVDALNSADPAAALQAIDDNWGRSSSLNNLERNKVVVTSAIDLAFLNDDHAVLSSVPDRFLNVDALSTLTDKIVANPNLNPKERQGLLDELPKLMEGRNLMEDDDVRQPVRDFLRPALDALGRSPSAAIQSLVAGKNLEMQVMRGYERDIQQTFMAEYEDTGSFPKGHRKRELIREVTDRAEARLEKLTRLTKE